MTSCLASMAGFPADVGSTDGNVSDNDPDPAADSGVAESMEAVFEQAQRIHRRRLEMIDLSPVSDTHQLREKNGLLVEWMQDLSRQNSLLIDTVRELEKEATERCLLLETCLSRNSSCHQCCQLRDEYEIILAQREEERREHVETINSLVRDHKTLQQLVILRDRHLAALQQQHKQQLQLVTTEADSCSDADSCHGDGKQAGVSLSASSTRLLLRRCNQLIIERDRALAQLNQPSSRLISRDKLPCQISADNMSCNGSLEQLPHCHKSCSPATLAHSVSVDAPYTRTHTVHCANASVQTTVTTVTDTDNDLSSDREITATNSFIQLNNQVEEGRQLVADLQGHLATAHDQLTVKDVTLQRVEQKLLTSREQLAECRQRLQQEEDRGACQTEQCDTLEQRLAELGEQLAHAELRVQQLTADNEQQQLQLSAVQEQLTAAQTAGHQLTEANIEKDMQIGQQWTTISTLKVNVLQLKQELDAMAADPRRPSPLGLGVAALVAPSGAAVVRSSVSRVYTV